VVSGHLVSVECCWIRVGASDDERVLRRSTRVHHWVGSEEIHLLRVRNGKASVRWNMALGGGKRVRNDEAASPYKH